MNLDTIQRNKPNIIHFFGSTTEDHYYGISLFWMRGAYENLIEREESPASRLYNSIFLHCDPKGTWSFPLSLDDSGIDSAEKLSLETVISTINTLKPIAAVPHMYCMTGMTTIRGLFEMLGVPVVGNTPEAMALSTHKGQTLCLLKIAGVPVAKNEILTKKKGQKLPLPSMKAPFVIKPCNEGNSFGLSLYKGEEGEDLSLKLSDAFKYGNEILVEEFIPLGYEVRAAVVEDQDENLQVLPICKYVLNESQLIRTHKDRLFQPNDDGVTISVSKRSIELPAISLPSNVISSIQHYAVKAHRALGCRDFSLFDIRVSPDGTPYFLEVSLYCSYASDSYLVMMSEAAGRKPYELFNIALTKAVERNSKKQLK